MSDFEVDEALMGVRGETGCDLDVNAAKEEAAWYSIMNALALNLGSGMGIPLDQSEMDSVFSGIPLNDMPLSNPMPIKAIFKSGDPHLLKQFGQNDLDTWRWSQDSFDRMFVPQAQGWSSIAQTECAKWFGIPLSSQSVSQELHSQWNAYGTMLSRLARLQCQWAFDNLRNDKGLFVTAASPGSMNIVDSATNLEDQACMLWACSDIVSLAGKQGSPFADIDAKNNFLNLADDLFQAINDNKGILLDTSLNKVLAQSVAVSALIWYASITQAQDLKARCLWLIREFADNLVKAQDNNELVGDTLIDAGAALRALTDAYRVTKLRTYAETASTIFNFIEGQWEKIAGLYPQTPLSRQYTFNTDDIAIIAGALNASRIFLKERVNGDLAELRMRVFFCKSVDSSGMQMSMPSPDFMPNWLMQREPSIHFRHGAIPLPNQAGGDFGIAPVFTGNISFEPQTQTWSRRMIFDAPASMHACCEFLWLNSEAINGFPDIHLEQAPLMVRQAAGVEA